MYLHHAQIKMCEIGVGIKGESAVGCCDCGCENIAFLLHEVIHPTTDQKLACITNSRAQVSSRL
jgi:hypothetical protein